MRAGHRFYIERDGSYFNRLNVHRFPKKNFCVIHTFEASLRCYSIVDTKAYIRSSTSNIIYISDNYHINRFLLCQTYNFHIPIGYVIIFKISLSVYLDGILNMMNELQLYVWVLRFLRVLLGMYVSVNF